ncbi:MAG: tripartite tricarboxylate transporter substrate binding protein, partial [Oscillospiraceae bacterium]
MKKKISALLCLTMALMMVAGCGSKPAADASKSTAPAGDSTASTATAWKFERKIEIVCPWGAGGGADTTLRTFATALEKEIGVPVVINNKSGAGGVTGVDFAIKQPADGYTWLLSTQSPLLAQLTGATDVKIYESTVPVTRLVHDTNIIIAGKDAPYNNLTELKAYIDSNPGKVKAGCMSITGLDGLTVDLTFDGKVEAVAYTEGAQLTADIMGGHMPLAVVGPAEVLGAIQSGDVKVITVCAEQRMTMPELKDVECTGELNVNSFYGPARGIFA